MKWFQTHCYSLRKHSTASRHQVHHLVPHLLVGYSKAGCRQDPPPILFSCLQVLFLNFLSCPFLLLTQAKTTQDRAQGIAQMPSPREFIWASLGHTEHFLKTTENSLLAAKGSKISRSSGIISHYDILTWSQTGLFCYKSYQHFYNGQQVLKAGRNEDHIGIAACLGMQQAYWPGSHNWHHGLWLQYTLQPVMGCHKYSAEMVLASLKFSSQSHRVGPCTGEQGRTMV